MRGFIVPLLLVFAFSVNAQTIDPLKQKTFTLVRFLDQQHYQPRIWNESSSLLLFNKWIETLDENKMIFTKSDVNSLSQFSSIAYKDLVGSDWKFFPASVNIYIQRIKKVQSIVSSIISQPLDFSRDEYLEFPFAEYASDDDEITKRWRSFIKWSILHEYVSESGERELSETDLKKEEPRLRNEFSKQRAPSGSGEAELKSKLADRFLNCVAWCYDPHTAYMNFKRKEAFETEMAASEFSVGLGIDQDENGKNVIKYLEPGGSAWKTGKIHIGDEIVRIKVAGKEKNLGKLTAEEIEDILNGETREEVELTVKNPAGDEKTATLFREKVSDDKSVVKSYVINAGKKIGYINLPAFYSRETDVKRRSELTLDGCANDVSKEIMKLKKEPVDGLILDLRYNGGGSMWEAMQLAGIFIDVGPVASVKDKKGNVTFLKDPNRGTIYDGPLLILINGASASASEFLAAALQDYNRAIIAGSTTYGKGTAQVIRSMDTIGMNNNVQDFVKVTTEKFFRVNGSTTQWQGVVPDVIIPDGFNDDYKERKELSALLPDQSNVGMYRPLPALSLASVKEKSEARISKDEYFLRMKARDSKIKIPLSLKAYAPFYRQKSNDKKMNQSSSLVVTNNSFDSERMKSSDQKTSEHNAENIRHIGSDKTLAEAANILKDFIGQL